LKADESLFGSQDLKRSLAEQVADSVEETIFAEELKPGTKLPPERNLAKLFGVTPATAGEAVTVLEQRGLITRRVGRGTFVAMIPHTVIADSIHRYWAFKSCTFEDLFELREIFEPKTAHLAALRADDEDLRKIKEQSDQIEKHVNAQDIEKYSLADAEFHKALAVASKNQLLIAVMSGLQQVMMTMIYEKSVDSMSEATIHNHKIVYEALAARDPDRAIQAMEEHMLSSREHFSLHFINAHEAAAG